MGSILNTPSSIASAFGALRRNPGRKRSCGHTRDKSDKTCPGCIAADYRASRRADGKDNWWQQQKDGTATKRVLKSKPKPVKRKRRKKPVEESAEAAVAE